MRQILLAGLMMWASAVAAQTMEPRDGWAVIATEKPYPQLVEDVKAAIRENGLAVVTEAGPTEAAKARGIEIPGNRVIGAFNNDFAVRILGLSVPAMIEAPLRFYVTEDPDGGATLSYRIPDLVYAPYLGEAGPELAGIVAELDAVLAEIAEDATEPAGDDG